MKRVYRTILFLFLFFALTLVCAGCAGEKFTARYLAGEGGRVEGAAEQILEAGADASPVTAQADEGYTFVKWSDGITTLTRTDRNLAQNLTVMAEFEKQVYYTVRYQTDGRGTIRGEAEQTVERRGSASPVTAIPNEGYEFVKWSDGVKTATRTDDPVWGDLTVTAEFVEKLSFTVRYETDGNGSVKGETEQTLLYGENASSVTAIPNEGYKFVKWSDGQKNALRRDMNVTHSLTVTAEFEKLSFTVRYLAGENGVVRGRRTQTVYYAEDSETVTAVADEGYEFLEWSDGGKTAERNDKGVVSDLTVTAIFQTERFTITYRSETGGTLIGETRQRLEKGESGTKVTAVAKAGYVFTGWSDLSWESEHDAGYAERDWEYVAYFEPLQKQFKYNYGKLYHAPMQSTVTVDRDNLAKAKFIVPELDGYTFLGWYTSEAYTTKVADETGRLMLGYDTFCLEETTLYARWEEADKAENPPVCKILFTVTDELHARLYSQSLEKDVEIDYKMTGIERKIFALTPLLVSEYLNEWFEGKVLFEADAYFTTLPVGTVADRATYSAQGHVAGSVDGIIRGSADRGYELTPVDMDEVIGLLAQYHSVLNTFGFNDYTDVLNTFRIKGTASAKSGVVSIEPELNNPLYIHQSLQSLYQALLQRDAQDMDKFVETYLHEFTHTVEEQCPHEYSYHKALYQPDYGYYDPLGTTKSYLLKRFEADGEMVGIPEEFWQHKIDVTVYYGVQSVGFKDCGRVQIVGQEQGETDFVIIKVPYGSEVSAEAIPYAGWRFVRWSDGVTTAVRHDKNIISYFNVDAIFEKIT